MWKPSSPLSGSCEVESALWNWALDFSSWGGSPFDGIQFFSKILLQQLDQEFGKTTSKKLETYLQLKVISLLKTHLKLKVTSLSR